MTTRRFEKQVAIKATDSAEQRATGVVLTPWAVDTQRDFLRPAGIKNLHTSNPETGVMHAAFPDGAAEVVRSDVLEEPTTIDGAEFSAGEWVITREYQDDELWSLVDDGVLNGFSIGGRITDDKSYAESELPASVTFPAGVERGPATEIRDGDVDEVSDVDIPAVPAAEYAAVKADADRVGKTAYHDAAGREEFIEMMADRGHSDADAGRLYDYIDRHAKSMSMTRKQEDDPEEAPRPDVGDAVRWESDASGAVDGWRYGVVVDGLQDSDDNLVLVAVYEPSDGEWENRGEQNPIDVDSLIPIGGEGVGSLPPIDQIQSVQDMSTESDTDGDEPDDATKWRRLKSWVAGSDDGKSDTDDDGGAEKSVSIPEAPVGDDVEAALEKAVEARKQGRSLNRQNRESLMAAHDAVETALASDLDFETNRFTDDPFTDFDVADYEKAADSESASTMTTDNDDDTALAEKNADRLDSIEEKLDEALGEKSADADEDAEKSGDERPEWADDVVDKVDEIEERVDAISKSTAGSSQLGQPADDEDDSEKRAAIEKEKEVFTR